MPGLNRRRVGGNIGGFDVDESGISRTEFAQFLAGPVGIAFLFEELPTLVIVDHRPQLPSYQPVILASVLDRSVMQYIHSYWWGIFVKVQ